LTTLDASVDLTDEVVDLALRLPDGDLRIEEASRANDLLDDARGMLVFVWAGRRRDEDRLVDHADELGEGEGAIFARRGEPEPVLDEHVLSRPIAAEHAAYLRQSHVGLVDEHQEVVREVVEQRRRLLTELPPGEVHRVVLDAGAIARL